MAPRSQPNGDEPQSFVQLSALLHERRDDLSKAQRKVAEAVLTDPEATAFMRSERQVVLHQHPHRLEAAPVDFARSLGAQRRDVMVAPTAVAV